jgi:hypothetical protein
MGRNTRVEFSTPWNDRASNSIHSSGNKPESRICIITLGVISNYLTAWFRGVPKENRRAALRIVKETKDGYYKSFAYSGPPENLGQVKYILDTFDNEREN